MAPITYPYIVAMRLQTIYIILDNDIIVGSHGYASEVCIGRTMCGLGRHDGGSTDSWRSPTGEAERVGAEIKVRRK